ncbi:hypothetical protein GCM10022251_58950 [Phytohabitans flavus]|uniref:Trypsin-co-occurring domain-containing protein n=1 Tax=Phytohabitans flavus TaxID=1076124 RepID=A0A6F8XXL3_9ACTN|nr:CU044_2847 family protein [Phytohabitans flavus]BCB78550.1 hypothetical protein Pflav_049600 [Phytohabitans flavus]
MASGLLRVESERGEGIVVEVAYDEPGFQAVSRKTGIAEAKKTFEEALGKIHNAADRALAVFRDGALAPDSVELEFGVRFNYEVGAVLAKTATEGHLTVKLTWNRQPAQTQPPG